LPTTPAIYFAIDATDTVQYIGRSVNPRQRWLQGHHKLVALVRMSGVRIAWLSVSSPELLPEIERALIDWFQPSLNRLNIRAVEGQEKLVAFKMFMPELLRAKFKSLCALRGVSMNQVLVQLVQKWVDEKKDKLRGKEK